MTSNYHHMHTPHNHTHTPQTHNHTHTQQTHNHTHTPQTHNHTHTPQSHNHTHTPQSHHHAHASHHHAHTPDHTTHAAQNHTHSTHNHKNVETYSLLWLDAAVNSLNENQHAQQRLRGSINHLVTFEDAQQCFEYIRSMSAHDRAVLIVSGHLGQSIVPNVVQFRQIVSIYVYCKNIKENEQWALQHSKVAAVLNQLDALVHQIDTDQHQHIHSKIDEPLPLSIVHAQDANSQRSVSDLNGDFIYMQILIDCLVRMKYDVNDKAELMAFCRDQYKDNAAELKIITKFEREYNSEYALYWYTREAFLYKMLNRALRELTIHLLYLFRFVIRHLQKQLLKYMGTSPVRVYRRQLMMKQEAQMLANSIGGFISVNTFFSCSVEYDQALAFSNRDDLVNCQRVCFVIDADPRLHNINPFADISRHSYFPKEKEILFMIGSIFQLESVKVDQHGILLVRMKLCSLDDDRLRELLHFMRKMGKDGETSLIDFAEVLSSMSKWDDAEQYYHRYLQQAPNNRSNVDRCYAGLGSLANRKGDYEASLKWHHQALEIKKRASKPDDVSIAESYNSIGNAYEKKKDYDNALLSYQAALEIFRRACGNEHLSVAVCMNNIGKTYSSLRKPEKALKFYENALSIQKKQLPAGHVNLGKSYKNIGNALADLGQYDTALSHLNLSLEIYRKSRPSQHPSIAATLRNIGLVYKGKRDYRQALASLEKAAVIYRQSFPATHPDVVHIEKEIHSVASKLV